MSIALSENQRSLLEKMSIVDVADMCAICAAGGCWVVARATEILDGNNASYVDFVELGGGVRMGENCGSRTIQGLIEEFKFA